MADPGVSRRRGRQPRKGVPTPEVATFHKNLYVKTKELGPLVWRAAGSVRPPPSLDPLLLDDKAKAQMLISTEMREMCAFHFETHKTADFHSNLLVSLELVTEDY